MVNTQMVSGTKGMAPSLPNRNAKKDGNVEDLAFDFGQMMNQSLNDMAQKSASGSVNRNSQGSVNAEMNFVSGGSARVKESDEVSQDNNVKQPSQDKDKKISAEKKDLKSGSDNEVESTTSQDKEQVLRDKVKDTLGVTDEQIDAALETLGISILDLFKPEVMTEFVVEVTGNESSFDLLTDNVLSQGLLELKDFAETLVDESFVSETDIPEMVLEDAPVVFEEKVEVSQEGRKAEDVDIPEKDIRFATESTEENTGDINPPKVEISDMRTGQNRNQTSSHSEGQKHSFEGSAEQLVFTNLNQAVENVMAAQPISQTFSPYDTVSIVNQIVDAARVTLNDQVSTMELMLNPENLGRVSLSVSLKEGVVTAQIVAENETAREAIESQVVMLKEQLNNQGLKIEAVEVTIASHSFEAGYQQESREQAEENSNNQKKSGVRHIDLSQLTQEDLDELTSEERLEAEMMAQQGSMVNYHV